MKIENFTPESFMSVFPADIAALLAANLNSWQYNTGQTWLQYQIKNNVDFINAVIPNGSDLDKAKMMLESLVSAIRNSQKETMPVNYQAGFAALQAKLATYTFDPSAAAQKLQSGGWITYALIAAGLFAAWKFLKRGRKARR